MTSVSLRLSDIIEASERLRGLLAGMSLEEFETDWQKQWLVERGIEIISEASRHPRRNENAPYGPALAQYRGHR